MAGGGGGGEGGGVSEGAVGRIFTRTSDFSADRTSTRKITKGPKRKPKQSWLAVPVFAYKDAAPWEGPECL